MTRDVSALILAGGRATRLGGIAKHELVIEGETIFARQCRVLAPRVAEIVVSGPRDVPGYRSVRDAEAGVGPLAGISAGLAAVSTDWLLVVAGDMPYISAELVDLVLGARAGDAVALRVGGLPEPLFCALHTRVAPVLAARIAAGRHKASGLLTDEGLRVTWLEEAQVRAFDPELRCLVNVNAPEDLRR